MSGEPTLEEALAMWVAKFNELWSEGGVKLAVDPSAPGVVLPHHVVARYPEYLVLHYPLCPVVPIDDLSATLEGVGATLSFDRAPHHTFVPWISVIAMAALYDGPDGNDAESPPADRRGRLRSVP